MKLTRSLYMAIMEVMANEPESRNKAWCYANGTVHGKPAVVALFAPDSHNLGGSMFYSWMRNAATGMEPRFTNEHRDAFLLTGTMSVSHMTVDAHAAIEKLLREGVDN